MNCLYFGGVNENHSKKLYFHVPYNIIAPECPE